MGAGGYVVIEVTIETQDLEGVLRRLEGVMSVQGQAEFLQGSALPHLQRRASDRFSNEGDDVTGAWAPLSPATLEWRTALGYDAFAQINLRSGDLQRWVTSGSGRFEREGGDVTLAYPGDQPSGTLREAVEGAQRGQKGSPSQPPRPVLGLGTQDAEALLNQLVNHVVSVVSGGARTVMRGGMGA